MSVTLKQLAELSGLSIRTVSRVLKNQDHVQPEKREQIMRLAREHNYVPNMAARNLRLNRSKFVGILGSRQESEIFTHKLMDLQTRLENQGFYPVVFAYDQTPMSLEKMFQDCSGTIDFMVVTLFQCKVENPSLPQLFEKYPMTPIYVDQDFATDNGHALAINRATGIQDAITTLIHDGKRKIIRCGSLKSREKGLLDAFQKTPTEQRPQLIHLDSDNAFDDGRILAPRILESGADAVFFDTDRQALGFINYASEHHIDIPRRISVIGFDDDAAGKLVFPALSTVAHPVQELNQAIVDIILQRPDKPVHRTFPTKFIRRMSS